MGNERNPIYEIAVILVREENIVPGNPTAAKKKFSIHKEFLVHYSPYFASALAQSQLDSLIVESVNHAAFGHFVHWLYHQNLDMVEQTSTLVTQVNIWQLGQRFSISSLQKCAMDVMHALAPRNLTLGFGLGCHLSHIFEVAASAHCEDLESFLCEVLVKTKQRAVFSVLIKHAGVKLAQRVAMGLKDQDDSSIALDLSPASDHYIPPNHRSRDLM
ncbi:uncharacterized protein RSE6_01830 [Rhynchosporium secalis]|uniref:BTB domain-containing protein n=1 Tax=Rhynchosporium secalis TaxID=38038 RepID=A0A1E1LYP7_RHYSE|nr:uncharacterized protein RSE6_01830 [Rhynchosporium secalis]